MSEDEKAELRILKRAQSQAKRRRCTAHDKGDQAASVEASATKQAVATATATTESEAGFDAPGREDLGAPHVRSSDIMEFLLLFD